MQTNITEYASSYAIHKARGYQAAQLWGAWCTSANLHIQNKKCADCSRGRCAPPWLFHSQISKTVTHELEFALWSPHLNLCVHVCIFCTCVVATEIDWESVSDTYLMYNCAIRFALITRPLTIPSPFLPPHVRMEYHSWRQAEGNRARESLLLLAYL